MTAVPALSPNRFDTGLSHRAGWIERGTRTLGCISALRPGHDPGISERGTFLP
jgi:hypothetical protein